MLWSHEILSLKEKMQLYTADFEYPLECCLCLDAAAILVHMLYTPCKHALVYTGRERKNCLVVLLFECFLLFFSEKNMVK